MDKLSNEERLVYYFIQDFFIEKGILPSNIQIAKHFDLGLGIVFNIRNSLILKEFIR